MTNLNDSNWLIYGANGYTGELIAREAVRQGLKPTLAGRNKAKVEALAQELGLDYKAFGLDNVDAISEQLQGFKLVMHCAGPFSATSKPMMEACIKAGAHYLDITGEIAVFELAQSLKSQAEKADIVLCPGVGFDVIPTDCVAAALKEALPDATHLALGFDSRTGFSPGTAKTSTEGMAEGGKIRKNGKITTVPLAHYVRTIDFGDGKKSAMSVPWGDVSTAFYTTGIPNIEVFVPAFPKMIFGAKMLNYVRPVLKMNAVQKFIKSRIEKTVVGPNEELRAKVPTYVWGEARNARGEIKTARIQTENAYSLTVNGSLTVVNYLLKNTVKGGTYTPAKLMGYKLVTELPGSGPLVIT
ncbi:MULTISPECIES: saccharopine dehydrogenase family protein [Acinetobacter calcoaceticus/baumannii complex]|uniref:saccharopine dehydrogenase family protein n=1 Tax=Acinetobacter calcoaceticus/baumannii complex TaxID=909768 RepID=UPI0004457049|nr:MULTISPECIES: saccharopine dehydrogenase NADP-binding domain-containing protein [Acinetobacter calcoaceticus/baumannii complex]AJB48186.1 membrane protein [Acinetobacter nosocomialis]EXE73179.1 saccharopine dehydrogenase family protein [Acinetobacter sp. 1566109]MBR7741520.1 saccharopine dehydrogenase NADP-binding domain-containing protein [Acinetobacter nosocomialis]MBR7751932.1 saccharopine dehydrogenase NADP-binding domain-containing protein [Acinetobacter nosocomialis]MDO7214313.1 sacch